MSFSTNYVWPQQVRIPRDAAYITRPCAVSRAQSPVVVRALSTASIGTLLGELRSSAQQHAAIWALAIDQYKVRDSYALRIGMVDLLVVHESILLAY